MKKIVGHLMSERKSDGTRTPLKRVRVGARIPGTLFDYKGRALTFVLTQDDGKFEMSVVPAPVAGTRPLEIVAYDKAGRELPFSAPDAASPRYVLTEDRRARIDERSNEAQFDYGDFIMNEADAAGLQTTLGTGQPLRFSEGNHVRTLMDRDAFACAAAMMRQARQEVLVSQLFFAIPEKFESSHFLEKPSLMFDFDQTGDLELKVPFPRLPRDGDARPERELLTTATRGVDVRILLHAFTVPLFLRIAVGILLFPYLITKGISKLWTLLGDDLTDTDEVRRYFQAAAAPNLNVLPFQQPALSAGVLHAKLMMMDRERMLSIGSPFGQSYVDRQDHAIDAWIRGSATGFPKHDAGFTITGPAKTDFLETMRLLWNDAAGAGDQLPAQMNAPVPLPTQPSPATPTILDEPEDGVCAVQFVRTLSCDQFDGMPQGEKGILEAYLRAFATAKDFIYLETQYFTNDAIGEGLVNALLSEAQLKVIVLLNIEPDVPTYPFKQRRLITRIRRAIGQTTTGPQRFGVFTRWTHETLAERLDMATRGPSGSDPQVKDQRPRLLPIYVHAMVGIVDNTWATIGSANLDGLSLDSSLPSDILNGLFNRDEQRAIEVNGVFFDTKDQPNNVVDILRRKLWAEHLGFLKADGTPDITAAPIQIAGKPADGWLKLWSDRASEALDHITKTPSVASTGKARVLPWPTDNSTHSSPRDHLTVLGVKSFKVAPLKSTRAFDFKTGDWKEGSKAKMDFD
jgi:phosphatidylserine/phosphatidylglycerophosphate/cardiolipin synthase-like enzyme